MNCGIVLFIYDRPQCTERVLDALKRNHIDELYVFQDGLGEKTKEEGWKRNIEIISRIDWCRVYYERNEHKADSLDAQIIYGINKAFEKKDEIIVIEDDCVVSDDCISFFEKCFETYRNNKKVISIDAYLEPIAVPKDYKLPVIATGISSTWGWGTWKDRWEEFQGDFEMIKKIGVSMKKYERFNDFGYSIKSILTQYWLLGTWDLWWSINVLVREGISIRPAYNKVHNIGFENPGTHTSGKSPWVVPICDKTDSEADFPEDIEIEPWSAAEFKKFYQTVSGGRTLAERQSYYRDCLERWLELRQQGKSIYDILLKRGINNIAIYGLGTIGKLLINELSEKDRIAFFMVTNKETDEFMGYPVYGCDEEFPAASGELSVIVIPGYDVEKIGKMIGEKFSAIYPLDSILS